MVQQNYCSSMVNHPFFFFISPPPSLSPLFGEVDTRLGISMSQEARREEAVLVADTPLVGQPPLSPPSSPSTLAQTFAITTPAVVPACYRRREGRRLSMAVDSKCGVSNLVQLLSSLLQPLLGIAANGRQTQRPGGGDGKACE